MTMDEKFVELIGKTQEILQKYGCANIYDWALERRRSGEITREKLEEYTCLYKRYSHRRSYLSRVSDEHLEEAENLYQLILEWEAEKKARQEEARQEAALYEGEEYIKEGDYVLLYGNVLYGSEKKQRARYDVFQVVKDLKLQPLYEYRFQKWEAAPIYDWYPEDMGNTVCAVIRGGFPKDYLSKRHSHIWSSEGNRGLYRVDGKWELFVAEDEYSRDPKDQFSCGPKCRNFRKVLCDGRTAISACFDPNKPLPLEKVSDYLIKHHRGEYYTCVAWGFPKGSYLGSNGLLRSIK